jgi:ribosomal protein S25/PAS domain-containing protein
MGCLVAIGGFVLLVLLIVKPALLLYAIFAVLVFGVLSYLWSVTPAGKASLEQSERDAFERREQQRALEREEEIAERVEAENADRELRRRLEAAVKERQKQVPPSPMPVAEAVERVLARDLPSRRRELQEAVERLLRKHLPPGGRVVAVVAGEKPNDLAVVTTHGVLLRRGGRSWVDDEVPADFRSYLLSPDPVDVAMEVVRRLPQERAALLRSPGRPAPRLVRDAREAELVVVEWLRYLGHQDAQATAVGADAGIDVEASEVVAQVKMEGIPTGRQVVQQLHGVARAAGKKDVFFSLAGYTREAHAWADSVGQALFRFDLQGEPTAVNEPAHSMMLKASAPRSAPKARRPAKAALPKRTPSQDDLVAKAAAVVTGQSWVSGALIRRELGIGPTRAARVLQALEERGIIGPDSGNGRRRVL